MAGTQKFTQIKTVIFFGGGRELQAEGKDLEVREGMISMRN